MTERYRKELISKNLKDKYGINLLTETDKENISIIKYGKENLEIPSPRGWIYDYGIFEIEKIINQKHKENKEFPEKRTEIYANLTKKEVPSKLEKILNLSIIISFTGFLFFFLEEITATGFIIGNIPEKISSIGIFSFILLILLLHFLKVGFKKISK